jgi:queuine tRNA-ribosyltransferase
MTSDTLADLPEEMVSFTLLNSGPSLLAPRIGRLSLAGRKPLTTPCYLPITSRGALPHVTHDTIRDQMSINSLYIALEDCTF